jgi:hypothetical protein
VCTVTCIMTPANAYVWTVISQFLGLFERTPPKHLQHLGNEPDLELEAPGSLIDRPTKKCRRCLVPNHGRGMHASLFCDRSGSKGYTAQFLRPVWEGVVPRNSTARRNQPDRSGKQSTMVCCSYWPSSRVTPWSCMNHRSGPTPRRSYAGPWPGAHGYPPRMITFLAPGDLC